MLKRILATLCAGGLLSAASAGAETYRIVDGRLGDARTGASDVLEGVLEISVFEPEGQAIPPSLLVDDFQLQAGARSFGPRKPVEFGGRGALSVQIADQIQFDGDTVEFARLRSGGELVAVDQREVTFRFVEFRAHARNASRLVGHLGDTLLPRRISLLGTLYEVDQHFHLPRGNCPVLPAAPGGGGNVIIGGGGVIIGGAGVSTGGVIVIGGDGGGLMVTGSSDLAVAVGSTPPVLNFESFEIQAGDSVTFQPPAVGGAVLARVTGGDAFTIEDTLVGGGSVGLLSPSGVVFVETSGTTARERLVAAAGTASAAAPTLAELGITAPSGAQVTFDGSGALTVRSEGDLLVAGGVIDVPGLTSLTLVTPGNITVEGMLELPPGVMLSLNAGAIVIEGDLPGSPGDVVIDPPPPIVGIPICDDLLPVFPAVEREVGSFSLVASAAEQVEIAVEPRRQGGRMHPGRHGIVPVAILGSADLDIRDVDERSLRLGPGEAEPTSHHGRDRSRRVDVNRDGEMDVVVRFDAREAGVAVGDTELCLFGETTDGTAIEGCDALETKPERQLRTRGRDDGHDRGRRGRDR